MVKKLIISMVFSAVAMSSIVAKEMVMSADECQAIEQYVADCLQKEALCNPKIAFAMQTEAGKSKLIALGVASLVVLGAAVVAYASDVWPFNAKKKTDSTGGPQAGDENIGSTPSAGATEAPQQSQTRSTPPNPSNNATPNQSCSPDEAAEDVGVRLLRDMRIAQGAPMPSGPVTGQTRKHATKRIPKKRASPAASKPRFVSKPAGAVPQPTRVQPPRWAKAK